MHSEVSHGNPNPNTSRLAFHFLRALARIQRGGARRSSPTPQAVVRRGGRIRRAAYASMALAAGPRRVWSRAVLHNLRRRPGAAAVPANRRAVMIGKKIRASSREPSVNIYGSQEDELRRLLPGGRRMPFCSLLGETGHFIQCLEAQVLLMQRIADSISG